MTLAFPVENKTLAQRRKVTETCHLQTLCKKVEKQAMQKIRPLSQTYVACSQETWVGHPRVLARVYDENAAVLTQSCP